MCHRAALSGHLRLVSEPPVDPVIDRCLASLEKTPIWAFVRHTVTECLLGSSPL